MLFLAEFVFLCVECFSQTNYQTNYQLLQAYKTGEPDPDIAMLHLNTNTFSFSNPTSYLQSIVNYIITNSDNNYEKVKKAHDFVSLYLSYDHEAYKAHTRPFFKKKLPDQNVYTTVLSRKAVCSGYAILFEYLCRAMSIECYYVVGYARGGDWDPYKKEKINDKKRSHAWNIVRIEGAPYLVDCTWDSFDQEDGLEEKEYSSEWLFAAPEHFIYTHYPEYPEHQLLEQTYSFAGFSFLPWLSPKYFETLKITSPTMLKIIAAAEEQPFEYRIGDGTEITFYLFNRYGKKPLTSVVTNYMNAPGLSRLNFSHFSTGRFTLKIQHANARTHETTLIAYLGYTIRK
jgi:hypothetical protein